MKNHFSVFVLRRTQSRVFAQSHIYIRSCSTAATTKCRNDFTSTQRISKIKNPKNSHVKSICGNVHKCGHFLYVSHFVVLTEILRRSDPDSLRRHVTDYAYSSTTDTCLPCRGTFVRIVRHTTNCRSGERYHL